MPDITIDGEFVTLRPLTVDDAALTLAWRQGDRAAMLHTGAQTVEQQESWIAARPDDEYNFIIALKDGRPVGMVSLRGIDFTHRHAEPGRFLIGDEQAVRGIPVALEAMMLIYRLAFDTLNLRRVHVCVGSENQLMIKWQKFMGMTEEGIRREHYLINGKFQDSVLFGMLEEEYRTKALPKMQSLVGAARKITGSPE